VIEKPGHVFDAFPGVSSQFGRAVTKDMQTSRGKVSLLQIATEATVRSGAAKSLAVCGRRRRPERLMRAQVLKFAPVGSECGPERLLSRSWQLTASGLAPFAVIRIETHLVLEGEVTRGQAKYL
jgi:hypothetical protein